VKALRFYEFGSFDQLKIEELSDPQAGPGEVVLQVRAASLNPSDAKNVLGRMEGTTLPRTPGRDFSGVVVDGAKDTIGAEIWGTGGDVGFTRDGSYAELMVLPARGVGPKPKNLSFEEASAVGTNFVTAWLGLIDAAHFHSGETVLVTGAAGGMAAAVTQIAKWKGGQTIGVNRVAILPERQWEAGIDQFFISNRDDNFRSMLDSVRQASGGRGVNVIFDCVGAPLFEPCLRTLGQQGRQVNIASVGERRLVRPTRLLSSPAQSVWRGQPRL